MSPDPDRKFVGIQISPISFVDEGIDEVLETLKKRVGVNVLMIGTVSWLGLKAGRSISHELDGWPDHGIPEPLRMKGGAYFDPHKEYYRSTFIDDFRAKDPELEGVDILAEVIPRAKGMEMKVMPELMEPLFSYAGHGSAENPDIPNLVQCMQVDFLGRIGSAPCTNNPDYRTWWHSMIEDQCRSYQIDGVMWCNERRSPLDQMMHGETASCFCFHCRDLAAQRGIDTEAVIDGLREVQSFFDAARSGSEFIDGAFIEFIRVLWANPEILLWERFWLQRNKDLDRELYGIVKWCDPSLEFGLNVWNRNHFNPFRKAQWPWAEQTSYSDWVKPITYQHQSGEIFRSEMDDFYKTIFRDVTPQDMTPILYQLLGLDEAPWDELTQAGMDPDTYVFGQCADAVRGVADKVPVYMGLGVDAPRTKPDQAVCTPDIVYRSVLATYRAGGQGVIYAPNYAGMKLSNLDGGAEALKELGLL
ncbi:MAG: hypothetical protein OEM32_05940 [Acidimicrobiia bacterium]|nr:hypothetical protein [Acidimicrobiia bacterium]